MKMLGKLSMLVLCVTAMAFGAIIDDFSSDLGPVSDSNPAIGVTSLGYLIVDKTAGANSNLVTTNVTGGEFTISTGTNTGGLGGAVYTGLWDLSAVGQAIGIDLMFKDLPNGEIEFWISSDGGTTRASSGMLALPASGPAGIQAFISNFTGLGGVTLTAVDAMGFTAFTSFNQDLSFDSFREYVVPEPGTYALMAAGLLGLFAIRRRKA